MWKEIVSDQESMEEFHDADNAIDIVVEDWIALFCFIVNLKGRNQGYGPACTTRFTSRYTKKNSLALKKLLSLALENF
jgi:hypothetical protein